MEHQSDCLISVSNVTKEFGSKVAVKDMSFSMPAGQICGLLGPNGAGKTTLFRLMMGILKPTTGSITVDGRDAFDKRVEVKHTVGFLPDEPVFYSYLSALEVLELSAAMHGLDPDVAVGNLRPLIEKMQLEKEIGNYADEFSRGMKKKLGILLALIHKPKLLILDEPTNGLDVESTRLFYELMQQQAAAGTTIIFSTHLMDHVTKLCSHAVIIKNGTKVAAGAIEELCSSSGSAKSLEEVFIEFTSGA